MSESRTLVLDVGEREGDVPKQQEFVMDDETPFLLWRGGRGCSKTTSGWARMLRRRWNFPGTKGIIIGPDYNRIRDGVIETAWQWTNADHVQNFSWSPPQKMVLTNGSMITFYTASDPNVTRSLEANDIWFDEHAYCPYQTWRVALGAKRLPPPKGTVNSMWATGTPQGYDWSFQVFGEEGKPRFKVFLTSIYENRKHLPKSYIEDMEAEYGGTDFEEQELLGYYTLFEGLVYPQFDQGNVWNVSEPGVFEVGVGGVDLGDVAPSVLVPLGIRSGQLWSPEEFYGRRVPTTELLVHMADFEKRYNIAAWFCEATADYFIQSARAAGFDVRPCPLKEREAGIRIVQHYLRDSMLHINTERSPNGARELRTYQHKSQNLGETFSETLVPANDHYPDALRYAVAGYELSPISIGHRLEEHSDSSAFYQWGREREPVTAKSVHASMFHKEKREIGSWDY